MYIVEKPTHQKGLYAILNLVEKRAYIGESIDMPIRALQHLVIISNDQSMKNADNQYMMMETNKQYWFFPIAYEETDNILHTESGVYKAELKMFLQIYERIFMYLVASSLQNPHALHDNPNKSNALYNNAKNKAITEMWKELISKIRDFHFTYPHSTRTSITFNIPHTATNKEIRKASETVLKKALQEAQDAFNADLQQRFGITLSDWNDMSRDQCQRCWDRAVKQLQNEHTLLADYFLLDETAPNFRKDYAAANTILGTPTLSKCRANELNIQWGEKSIFDPEVVSSLLRMGVFNKFGSHHGETPYEILLKMQIDIQRCGYSYWALKNINEDWVRTLAERRKCDKKPIYAIFSFTPSDSTNHSGQTINLQQSLSEEEIIRKDIEHKQKNEAELMNWWRESNRDPWKPIDNQITYITIPGKKKAVGFKVTDFWFTKEVFNSNELLQHFIAMPHLEDTEAISSLSSQQTAVCVALKADRVEEYKKISAAKSNWVNGLVVKLEYPYVVQLKHDIP